MLNLTIYNFSSTDNIGDKACSPHLYVDWLKDVPVKMPDKYVDGPSIFGGGGLFHPGTDSIIVQAVQSRQPTALWGVGLNYHGLQTERFPKFLNECEHVGLRHVKNPWTYVPCVSCLSPDFDDVCQNAPQHDLAVYEHRNHPIPLSDVPRINNFDGPLRSVLEFLSNSKTIVTNSFHGAYWCQLIGRNVLIYQPFSNRFMALNSHTISDVRDIQLTNTLPEPTLEDCRNINRSWSQRLYEYFQSC